VCTAAPAGTCYPVLSTGPFSIPNSIPANYRFGCEFYPKVTGLTIWGVAINFTSVGAGNFFIEWDNHDTGVSHRENFAGVSGLHTYYFATPCAMPTAGSGHIFDVVFGLPNSGYAFTTSGAGSTPIDTTQLHYNKFIYQSDLTSGMIDFSNNQVPLDPVICTANPLPATTVPASPATPPTALPVQPTLACSTTADLCTLVNTIVQQLAEVRLQVDLIQRQDAPVGYVVGTVHSGLTGAGSFTVGSLLGLLIQTSTTPAAWGLSHDTPARNIPEAVTVAVGTADGDQDSHFSNLSEELWFPTDMAAMTKVSYSFRPGCGGAITELLRAP